jgi:hypothetical protein
VVSLTCWRRSIDSQTTPSSLLHPRFRPIPLGLSKFHEQQPAVLHFLRSRNFENPFSLANPRKWIDSTALSNDHKHTGDSMFVGFRNGTNPSAREPAWQMGCAPLEGGGKRLDPLSCNATQNFEWFALYSAMVKFPFALSPPGTGLDSHRTWEILLLGVIPVVKKNPAWDVLFRKYP